MTSNLIRCVAIAASLVLGVPTLSGCSMSQASSKSFASMASIWSLSASFRSSFGGRRAGLDRDYTFDVAAAGVTAVGDASPVPTLRADLARVAESHGVTDFEAREETWLGLGIGLRHAGLSAPEARELVTGAFGGDMASRTLAVYAD